MTATTVEEKPKVHSTVKLPTIWKDYIYKFKEIFFKISIRIASFYIGLYVSFIAFLSLLKVGFKTKSLTSIFSSPKERPLPPEILSNYGEPKYIQLKNVKLFYVKNGEDSKPLIIFLHGFPDFWFTWKEQIKCFAEKYHTVAVDLRGYDYSEKFFGLKPFKLDVLVEDLKNLIEALGQPNQPKPTIVAHGFGATILYSFLLKYPDLVEKYVALSVPPHYAFNINIKQIFASWYIYFFQLPLFPELYLKAFDVSFGKFNGEFAEQSKEVADAYKFTFGKPGAFINPLNYFRANISTILLSVFFGEKDLSKKPFPPGLSIYGEKDGIYVPASYKDLKKVPYLQFKGIPNGNHFVHQQLPSVVNPLIESFLQTGISEPKVPEAPGSGAAKPGPATGVPATEATT